ncbi:hypothetical protein COM24_23390 [Bacillus toyonensis]|nr:hypothetical protein COM24_23390 [Bacillus toyonensis]
MTKYDNLYAIIILNMYIRNDRCIKLHKVIVIFQCSILFLSACSSLSIWDYLNVVAKESSDAEGDLKKIGDLKPQ